MGSIAVLGGGITGLTCAYTLSKALPKATIRLVESSSRLGGWLGSHRQATADGYDLVFESGPRSMRPRGVEGWATLALVSSGENAFAEFSSAAFGQIR